MKVVIDTNVFISSFFGGKPGRIIDLWKRGEIKLCLSDEVLDEYVRLLEEFDLGESELAELLQLFREQYNLFYAAQTPNLQVVEADPDDDKFIECAIELEAEAIVTGDQDLLRIESYMRIPIQTPAEFLKKSPP